jgi:U3 small nucleolar RNA-associated protein 20
VSSQGYVGVLAELIRTFVAKAPAGLDDACRGALHLDLACLLRDDPETDFFQNVMHIQVHRRSRALQRVRKALAEAEEAGAEPPFATPTVVHILVPLASQPLFSSESRADATLLHEAIHATGALARLLSWSHYNRLVQRFLRRLQTQEGMTPTVERALVSGMCQVLDAFHFSMSPEAITDEPADKDGSAPLEEADGADGADGADEMEVEQDAGAADEAAKVWVHLRTDSWRRL